MCRHGWPYITGNLLISPRQARPTHFPSLTRPGNPDTDTHTAKLTEEERKTDPSRATQHPNAQNFQLENCHIQGTINTNQQTKKEN